MHENARHSSIFRAPILTKIPILNIFRHSATNLCLSGYSLTAPFQFYIDFQRSAFRDDFV